MKMEWGVIQDWDGDDAWATGQAPRATNYGPRSMVHDLGFSWCVARCTWSKRAVAFVTAIIFSWSMCVTPVMAETINLEGGSVDVNVQDNITNWNVTGNPIWNIPEFNVNEGSIYNIAGLGSGSSLALLVNGGSASNIFGTMNLFNLDFILQNIAGINIGASAMINLNSASLIASTLPLNLSATDFVNRQYAFSGQGGFLMNEGKIVGDNADLVALVANAIENRGVIEVPMGTVALAAGDTVTVGISPDGMVTIGVDAATANELGLTDQIKNTGTISANGGRVVLNAKAIDSLFDKAIHIAAGSNATAAVVSDDGVIEFVAQGDVAFTGKTILDGDVTVAATGDIEVIADVVASDTLRLFADAKDLSGEAAGGTGAVKHTAGLIEAETIYIDGAGNTLLFDLKSQNGIYIGNKESGHLMDTIAMNGRISGTGRLYLIGDGSTTTLTTDVITEGTAIEYNDSLILAPIASNSITLATTGGGHTAGADITIIGSINSDSAETPRDLILDAGESGSINVSGAIGGVYELQSITVSCYVASFDDVNATSINLQSGNYIDRGNFTASSITIGLDSTTYSGTVFNGSVINDGSINGSTMNGSVDNRGVINYGDFNGRVNNESGTIYGGNFYDNDEDHAIGGTINLISETLGGTSYFSGTVTVENEGVIQSGYFLGEVSNSGTIEGGTYYGSVTNHGIVSGGSFSSSLENNGVVWDGHFVGEVENDSEIHGGAFDGSVDNDNYIYGGVFNSSVTSDFEIYGGEFNGAVENSGTLYGGTFNGNNTVETAIGGTIDVQNGFTLGGTSYFSSAVTVNEGGTIESGNYLGVVTNNGTIDGGAYYNTVNNAEGAFITDGAFFGDWETPLYNDGTIEGGAFDGLIYNSGMIEGGEFFEIYNGDQWVSGFVSGGTFQKFYQNSGAGSVTGGDFSGLDYLSLLSADAVWDYDTEVGASEVNNYSGSIRAGTFSGIVMNEGEINGGTFDGAVTNNGVISDGTFNASVSNEEESMSEYGTGMIEAGVFNGEVSNRGMIAGGTYNNTVSNFNYDWEDLLSGAIYGGIFNGNVTGDGTGAIADAGAVFNGQVTDNILMLSSGSSFDGTQVFIGDSGVFGGYVYNFNGIINDGTFTGVVYNARDCTISGGVFEGSVDNLGEIHGGVFSGTVYNALSGEGFIDGGIFQGEVTNNGYIWGGTFNGRVGYVLKSL